MELHFPPEIQAQLEQMARDTGRRSDELVENVVTDFFEDFAFTRERPSIGATTIWKAAGLNPSQAMKNTAQNAGIEIKVFGKSGPSKRGPQLGTIRIGQGSFAWWAKSAKLETKNGKRSPTLRLGWTEFAEHMEKLVAEHR